MRPGEIVVDRASRRFLVRPQPVRTLKEALLSRNGAKATEVWALRDVSMRVVPGEAVGLIGRNGSGKTTLLRLAAGIFAELERFIDIPVRTYSSGMYMRLGFAVAAHIDADLILLDEVFAVGDEEFQRKCFAKIFEFKQRGGTIVYVSHDAASVERLCERAVLLRGGSVEIDGSTQEALARYHKLLADERDPEESTAGLTEYGSGEARIVEARLLGPEGEPRQQLLAGEPATVELRIAVREALPPPRISLEVRNEAGLLLAAEAKDTRELGWREQPGERVLRFDIERPPLADGRFRLRFELSDEAGRRLYHWLDDGVRFVVYPGEPVRGPVLLTGSWSLRETGVE